jgi:hypothetical protein
MEMNREVKKFYCNCWTVLRIIENKLTRTHELRERDMSAEYNPMFIRRPFSITEVHEIEALLELRTKLES